MRWLLCLVVVLCSGGLAASTSVDGHGKGGVLSRAGGAGWRRLSGTENGVLDAGRFFLPPPPPPSFVRSPPPPPPHSPPPPSPPPPHSPPPPFPPPPHSPPPPPPHFPPPPPPHSPPPPPHPPPPSPPPPSPPPPFPPPPSPPPPSPPPPPKTAVLSSLELSSGTLTPSFSEDTFSYTASVESSVSEIQVTVYLPDDEIAAGYEVNINGASVESGSTSSDQELGSSGDTTEIVVTLSVNGYISSTYLVYVTRESKSGLGTVWIVLIVVACVIVLALILLGIYCCCIRGLCPVNWVPEACIPARFLKRDDYQEVPHSE